MGTASGTGKSSKKKDEDEKENMRQKDSLLIYSCYFKGVYTLTIREIPLLMALDIVRKELHNFTKRFYKVKT